MNTFKIVLLALSFVGCASMVDKNKLVTVEKEGISGITIHLNGGPLLKEMADKEANARMNKMCPNGYQILEKGNTQKLRNEYNVTRPSASLTTQRVEDVRYIQFTCVSG